MKKYRAYPEYKDSGVEWLGEVPGNWEIKALKHTSKINVKTLPEDTDENYEFEYVDIGCVSAIEGIKKTETMKFSSSPSRARRLVSNGDVIVSTVRTYLRAVTPIKENASKLVVSTGFCVITPIEKLHPDFCSFMLRSTYFIEKVVANSVGVSYPATNASDISNISVFLPPLPEQKAIASFLDKETAKIDTLIEKQEKLINLLQEKRRAVISHAVTKGLNPDIKLKDSRVEWLGKVPEHWEVKKKISDFSENTRGSFVNGPFGSDLLSSELREEGVPVIYIRDIKKTGYNRKSKDCVTVEKSIQLSVCKVTSGDILIAKVGDPPGDSCVYPEGEPNAIITQDVIRIRVNKNLVEPKFLSMLINSNYGQTIIDNISIESTRKRISLGDLKSTRFHLPPLPEQQEIATFIDNQTNKIDTLIDKCHKAISLMKERRSALISAAVTGKIDVRNITANKTEELITV